MDQTISSMFHRRNPALIQHRRVVSSLEPLQYLRSKTWYSGSFIKIPSWDGRRRNGPHLKRSSATQSRSDWHSPQGGGSCCPADPSPLAGCWAAGSAGAAAWSLAQLFVCLAEDCSHPHPRHSSTAGQGCGQAPSQRCACGAYKQKIRAYS
jgi:hypothetical protein